MSCERHATRRTACGLSAKPRLTLVEITVFASIAQLREIGQIIESKEALSPVTKGDVQSNR